MSMNLLNINEDIRTLMLKEIDFDVDRFKLYISPRLNLVGRQSYQFLLKDAVQNHDVAWLTNQIHSRFLLNSTETRKLRDKTIQAKVPDNANEILAEDEFNRFYMRALCIYAINNKISSVIVYRAKEVQSPLPESWKIIGTIIDPKELLEDLRQHVGQEPKLGVGKSGSGLSVMLP
jgi:hypothetical protein